MLVHPIVERKKVNSWSYGEAKTAAGQLVCFSFELPDDRDKTEFVKSQIVAAIGLCRHIEPPENHRTNVTHGGYGRYSRYVIDQHKYGGGHGGYIELLEIRDAPDDRCPIVIYQYATWDGTSAFTEFDTKENAIAAFEKCWCKGVRELEKHEGFLRHVECGIMTPWFYAQGDQPLTGDFAYPSEFFVHPLYQVGKKFVVSDYDGGNMRILTCMGATERMVNSDSYSSGRKYKETKVYFDDGSIVSPGHDKVRPLEDDELWIDEAMNQFRKLLGGMKTTIEVPFRDGSAFVGRIRKPKAPKEPSHKKLSGSYDIEIRAKRDRKTKTTAGVYRLELTPEIPTPEAWIEDQCKKYGVDSYKVIRCQKVVRNRKKSSWKGVFEMTRRENDVVGQEERGAEEGHGTLRETSQEQSNKDKG